MTKTVRYRSRGGAIVTFTASAALDDEMPRWECGGCGEQETRLFITGEDAQAHAARCRALPG